MADYTTGTGTMITPTSEYTKSKRNICPGFDCPLILNVSCDTFTDSIIGGPSVGCQYPDKAISIAPWTIPASTPANSGPGYGYDCVVPKTPTDTAPWTTANISSEDTIYG